jgi:LysR family transcriptional activator of glutamate synthase operon
METHQLEYFMAVTKFRQFSEAAENIFVSQSTLSSAIKKLEEEFGVHLFKRTSRYAQLTAAGEIFLTYTQKILNDIEEAKTAMASFSGFEKGAIKLGVMPVISCHAIMPIIASFQKVYPKISMEITEDTTRILLKKLESGELDIAFVDLSTDARDTNLEHHRISYDPLVLLAPITSRYANRGSIPLSELKNEKFMLQSGLKNIFVETCRKSDFKPNITIVSMSAHTLAEFVKKGIGIAPLSQRVAERFVDSETTIIKFTPPVETVLAESVLITNKNPVLGVFQAYIKDELDKLNIISELSDFG